MDVLSHGLWGYALCWPKARKEKKPRLAWWGFVVGVLPDVISFLPAQVYFLLKGFHFSPALFFPVPQHWVFAWAIESYNFTHSLVIFSIVVLLYWLIKKRVWWPLLPWGLHILMDIPTHPDFFSTPFLFPLSHFKLSGFGMSWATPVVFFSNWIVLAVVLIGIIITNRRGSKALTD